MVTPDSLLLKVGGIISERLNCLVPWVIKIRMLAVLHFEILIFVMYVYIKRILIQLCVSCILWGQLRQMEIRDMWPEFL